MMYLRSASRRRSATLIAAGGLCWLSLLTSATATFPADAPQAAASAAAAGSSAETAAGGNREWTMWGGSPARNHVNPTTGLQLDIKAGKTPADGQRLAWIADLGSHTYGNPIVAGGRIFVSTNNGRQYRPQHKGDRGVLLCLDEATGAFQWQLTREKLASGKANDWPEQGICSTPCVEGDRLYVVTNRCEIMCLDVDGFRDGTNDGVYQTEVDTAAEDADVLWSVDMIAEHQVYPHNMATSSPVIYGDLLYVMTSNGIDEAHERLPAPEAPSLLALHKLTGKVVWQNSTPSTASRAPEPYNSILHGQWSSPTVGVVNGRAQVFLPGGDGVLYGLDAASGDLLWWFDLNPKDAEAELAGRGDRSEIISTPVFVDNSIVLSLGQDPEHGDGVGHIYRISATRAGDISPQIADGAGGWQANPNSGQIWHFGGRDVDGQLTGEADAPLYRRTICTAVVHDGLVFCPDLSGFLHCLDFATGRRHWEYDLFSAVWGSPLIADGQLLLGDEDGELTILPARATLDEQSLRTIRFRSSIYSTPTLAGGMLYIADRSRLYAFRVTP